MFDGEEIPQKKMEGEQTGEPIGELDLNAHSIPSTSQEGPETIQMHVLSSTVPTEEGIASPNEPNDVPDFIMENSEAVQVLMKLF